MLKIVARSSNIRALGPSKFVPEASKIEVGDVSKSQDAPKRRPRPTKRGLRAPKRRPRSAQERPRDAQEAPKTAQETPRSPPNPFKSLPSEAPKRKLGAVMRDLVRNPFQKVL